MRTNDLLLPILALATLASGCDKTEAVEAKPDGAVAAKYTVKAEEVDLQAMVTLIEREDVRDAESVEALLNAEDSPIQLDVDADGTRDFVSVREVEAVRSASGNVDSKVEAGAKIDVEVEDGATARFEVLVVPSSTLVVEKDVEVVVAQEAEAETVVVATLDFKVDVKAEAVVVEAAYAPVVVIAEGSDIERVYVHEIHIHDHHDGHIVVAAPFVAWVWLGARPVYVGHYHLPPGHAKHMGLHWHHGHHVDVHHHGHVDVHHGGHGNAHVKIKSKGGPSGNTQVKIKSKGGGGGGGSTHVKVKGGGGGGGKGKGK